MQWLSCAGVTIDADKRTTTLLPGFTAASVWIKIHRGIALAAVDVQSSAFGTDNTGCNGGFESVKR